MGESDHQNGNPPEDAAASQHQRTPMRWRQRPTVRQLRKDHERLLDAGAEWIQRQNIEARLPDGEVIHMGGVTLVEAFTPSTVSNLYDTLNEWQRRSARRDSDLVADLERSRGGGAIHWASLGMVRQPEASSTERTHQDLPPGVQAVWLKLTYLMPSVALVCATFTFDDGVADLSDLLRAYYTLRPEDIRVIVDGHFGNLRARIPWSRPKKYKMWSQGWDVVSGKAQLVQRRVWQREAECAGWIYAKFKGRFAIVDPDVRPTARLIFTEKAVPFKGRDKWAQAAGLDRSLDVYRSTDMSMPGWALRGSGWARTDHRYALTIAARRADVGDAGASDMTGQSNLSLTQRFSLEQSSLVARFALLALLDLYAARLGRLRDTAAREGRIRRPVHDARDLDRYLVGDGLDAATITSDIANLTKNPAVFGWDLPDYTGDISEWPEKYTDRKPVELVASLRERLAERSARLAEDTANTDGNIRASAELRQAIANTRLQRLVIALTILAVVIAILSFIHG